MTAPDIHELLEPLVAIFGATDASKMPRFWEPYYNTLRGLRFVAVKSAVDEYVGLPTSEFFPKPGPLKALVAKYELPLQQAEERLRAARGAYHNPNPEPERIEKSDEDRAAVRKMVAELTAILRRPKDMTSPKRMRRIDEDGVKWAPPPIGSNGPWTRVRDGG